MIGVRGGDLSTFDRMLDRKQREREISLGLFDRQQADASNRMQSRHVNAAADLRAMLAKQQADRDFGLRERAMQEDSRRFDLTRTDSDAERQARLAAQERMFGEDVRRFDTTRGDTLADRQARQQMAEREFGEGSRRFDATQGLQRDLANTADATQRYGIDQSNTQRGLDRTQASELARMPYEKMTAAQLATQGFADKQFGEQVRQFDLGRGDSKEAREQALKDAREGRVLGLAEKAAMAGVSGVSTGNEVYDRVLGPLGGAAAGERDRQHRNEDEDRRIAKIRIAANALTERGMVSPANAAKIAEVVIGATLGTDSPEAIKFADAMKPQEQPTSGSQFSDADIMDVTTIAKDAGGEIGEDVSKMGEEYIKLADRRAKGMLGADGEKRLALIREFIEAGKPFLKQNYASLPFWNSRQPQGERILPFIFSQPDDEGGDRFEKAANALAELGYDITMG
jgi:hypothetical protein